MLKDKILDYLVIIFAIFAIILAIYCMLTSAGMYLKIISFIVLLITLVLEIISNIIKKRNKNK